MLFGGELAGGAGGGGVGGDVFGERGGGPFPRLPVNAGEGREVVEYRTEETAVRRLPYRPEVPLDVFGVGAGGDLLAHGRGDGGSLHAGGESVHGRIRAGHGDVPRVGDSPPDRQSVGDLLGQVVARVAVGGQYRVGGCAGRGSSAGGSLLLGGGSARAVGQSAHRGSVVLAVVWEPSAEERGEHLGFLRRGDTGRAGGAPLGVELAGQVGRQNATRPRVGVVVALGGVPLTV